MSLKVLHLSSERAWRGGEQQIAYLIDEGKKYGHDVRVVVRRGSEFEKYVAGRNIPYYPLGLSNSMDLKSALALKAICTKFKPDVLHVHSSKSHGIAVLSEIFGNKTPIILGRRVNFAPKNSWFTRFKYNHPSVKKIICVSNKVNNSIRQYIKSPDKSVTVYSGIDINKFAGFSRENVLRKEYNIESNVFIAGTVSALDDSKDLFTFLKGISMLKRQPLIFRAFIVGSGPQENELRNYAAQLQLTDIVTFTGFRKDIEGVMTSLDAFVMTSKEEGLGTSILDAFAARIPVVATAAGGIPEMVIDNKTGILISIGDAHALASGLQKLIQDRALVKRLTDSAHQLLTDTFSKEQMARKTFDVYEEVLTKR